ncbi:Bifunctional oligoribonuclease and PAP phosphatase nrnA [Mycoplasmopsis californica]|uniref:DHHA1 domain-containing protein n=1 Tax=Mycoplasmopsis equigenitalium TaxID=114883 RepID=A0ABY5J1N5_9BACT|nr:DHHA1 domain-containing protein [Mycoplasmopsis equigenitalium]UUD36900.1 DHHA1 domain-containing protein [Mycoplasmopsis equigenitalium]VEU69805.1 Bifunctional oligoribonuclease and PAP phosphatase nrnA [Mycoplasmopsis californica]
MKQQFKKFWSYILKNEYITLCTHIEPDGDTLGSAVALAEVIKLNAKNVKQVKISGGVFPRNLNFLINQQISTVSTDFFEKSLKIVIDTSTVSRIYDDRVVPEQSLKIDHHPLENNWLFEIGGDKWPATGQLLTQVIKELKLKVNYLALEGLAVAIITDTENFKERNITSETFEAMAFLLENGLDYLNLVKKMSLLPNENKQIFKYLKDVKREQNITYVVADEPVHNDIVRPLVAKLAELSDTEVCVAFLKKDDGNYRAEIRSKTNFDVSKIATHFGGGGHLNSSGFIVKNRSDIKQVLDYIKEKNSQL